MGSRQGFHFLLQGTVKATRAALPYFELAVDIDPSLAEAHTGAGTIHAVRYDYGWVPSASSLFFVESIRNT